MTKPTGLVLPPPASVQMNFVETVDARLIGGVSAGSANAAYLARVRVSKTIDVSTIRVYVGTQSGNLDVGIYVDNGGTTYDRIASSGSTACGTGSAVQALSLTAAVTLSPGMDYWFACARDNTTATLLRAGPGIAAVAALHNTVIAFATSFPLPTTLTKASASGDTPTIWMRGS